MLCLELSTHLYLYFFADFTCHSYQHNISEMFGKVFVSYGHLCIACMMMLSIGLFFLNSEILCQEELVLMNGEIFFYNYLYYFIDDTAPYSFYTSASHTCNDGFVLDGDEWRSCLQHNGTDGEWNGVAPTCQRGYMYILISLVSSCKQSLNKCSNIMPRAASHS